MRPSRRLPLRPPRLTPTAYRRITFVAGVLLATIIVTGGAVRLTQSGLGCSDWPNCSPGHLVPHGASDVHGWVEYTNRLFTGAVSIAVIVAVLGSLARVPRRRDLVWLSVGLVVGVLAQIVLGALAVAFDLAPPFVMAHFLLSLALLTNAIVLHKRAGESDARARPQVRPPVRLLGRALLVTAACVVISGTVVTSTGPHGGDAKAKRFDLYLPHVARVHGSFVVLFLGLTLLTLWFLRRTRAPFETVQRLGVLFAVSVAQGAIGYIQYFNGIPALLVGFHIAGATAVWAATVHFYLGLFTRPAEAVVPGSEAPGGAARETLAPTPTPA
ncbi:MAG TPA: COX15/CtaA family protein [Acidimicrobiia bacterium]|nr:COX15/CtaA family protein [Acidimicrobiia bacterium]